MTTHPDLNRAALGIVREKATIHRQAADMADADRRERDKAIRWAAAQGLGIREIARATDLDPSLVSRIVRPR
jgi:hypothetical protein